MTACGGGKFFKGKDNAEKPKKLIKYKREIEIKRLWEKDTGSGVGKLTLRLKASIDSDRVYSADYRGRVSAYKLKDGDKIWSIDTKKPISSGTSVGFGKVFVGTSQGEVLAINAINGKIIWKSRVSSEVLSAPGVGRSIVVIRSIDGVITGLSSNTGQKIWQYKRRAPRLTIRGSSAPIVSGSTVYAGFDNGKVVGLNVNTGRLLWQRSISAIRGRTEIERLADIDTDPIIRDGVLYVAGYQGKLAAISIKDVQLLWTRKMSSIKSLAVDYKNVYVTDEHSQVWAYDKSTGVSVWKQSSMRARKMTGPAVLGEYIVVGDYQGYLHWLSRDDGRVVARYKADGRGYIEAPTVINNMLITLGKGGELTALSIRKKKNSKEVNSVEEF